MKWFFLLVMGLTAGCYQVTPYKTWECHHSIAYVTEWRGNCVIYEAIVEEAGKLVAMGARPYSLRMNEESLSLVIAEEKVVRHRLSSGGSLWVIDTIFGAMRVIKDDRLGDGQFIVGRGWDVKSSGDEGDAARHTVPDESQPSLVHSDNDVEF